MDKIMRPRADLWPHLTNHERACLMDWWVELDAQAQEIEDYLGGL